MTISGVSILASKLQRHKHVPSTMASVSASRESTNTVQWPNETIKLADSMVSAFGRTKEICSVDEIREELKSLIAQCRSQEESLLYFHTRFHHQQEAMEQLREKLILRMRLAAQLKVKVEFFHAWQSTVGSGKPLPVIQESMNLNETLRNLALSLESPTSVDPNMSMCSSISAPFQVARRHRR